MKSNDLLQFEEKILKYLKENENKIIKQISQKYSEMNDNINNFESKVNNLLNKNESIIETITNHKIYIGKMTEFETFKNKADDILISHEIKLKNYISEINCLKGKYDKIMTENLLVPGYIGNSCQYRNLSDFLSYLISETNKIKTDDGKKEIKDLKSKCDNLMKSMINLNDGTIERCKDYINNLHKDIISSIENRLKGYEEKNFEYKTDIYQYNSDNEQKFNEINEKLKEIKKELNDIMKENMDEIKNNNNIMNDKIEKNKKNIQKNYLNIKNINNDIEEITLYLNDIITNLKYSNLPLNNNTQSQGLQTITINEMNNTKNNISKILPKNANNKDLLAEYSKMNKKYVENNSSENNSKNKINNMKLQNLKSFFKPKPFNNNKNEIILKKNIIQNDIENDENSEKENYKSKIKNIYSSNSSFEQSKIIKINNKNIDNNINNNNNINMEQNEQNLKVKTISNDLNKNYKKEKIEPKSNSIKDRNIFKSQGILYRYKSKDNNKNIHSQKILHLQKNNYNKSQTQKEIEFISPEKDNPKHIKIDQKLKLNYDLINKIYKNKVLDLYSFSISPPDGKIDLNYLTINDNIPKNLLDKQKMFELEKENGINSKVVSIGTNVNNKIKPIYSQSNIQGERKKIWQMKNKVKTGLSTERINLKKINNDLPIYNNAIINIPPKFNIPFNKTFIEKDYIKEKNNLHFDNFKLRNTMKELNIKDNIYCLTGNNF